MDGMLAIVVFFGLVLAVYYGIRWYLYGQFWVYLREKQTRERNMREDRRVARRR